MPSPEWLVTKEAVGREDAIAFQAGLVIALDQIGYAMARMTATTARTN